MPLGDSITQGCCSATEGGYRTKLYINLTSPAQGFNVDFIGTLSDYNVNPLLPDRDHEGHGGDQIEQIRTNIAWWLKKIEDPDVILLHIGTNDFWAGRTLLETQNSLKSLLADLSALRPHAKIIVATLIPRTDSYEDIQAQYNSSLPAIVSDQVMLGRQVSLVDMHSSLLWPDDLSDQVHPTPSGYDKMADQWVPAINHVITPLGSYELPQIAGLDARVDLTHVAVRFTKPVEDNSAVPANFTLSGGVSVLAAELDATTRRVVTLTTSAQTPAAAYSLTVSGVSDRTAQHHTITPASSMTFTSRSIIDGSFEAGGSSWTRSGNVSIMNSPATATEGVQVMVFNDGQTAPNGMLSQSFATQPGQKYRLSFDMGVHAYNTYSQTMHVTVAAASGGTPVIEQTETLSGTGGGTTVWKPCKIEFVANSANTLLTFTDVSTLTNNIDCMLDDVRIDAEIIRILTVNNTSSYPVPVTVSPSDLGGNSNGPTSLSRSYDDAAVVTLTVPLFAPDGSVFLNWQKNGINITLPRSTAVTMDGNITMTANYVTNMAPVANSDSYSGFIETPIMVAAPGVLANDTDSHGAPMRAILDAAPSHGSLTLNSDGSFTHTPTTGYIGTDSFTYHANDGELDSNIVTVSLTINSATLGLLVNGSFELGNPADMGSLYGWTQSGNVSGITADTTGTTYTATSGKRLVIFSPGNNNFDGIIHQTFPTVTGQLYTVGFDVGILGTAGQKLLLQASITGSTNLITRLEELTAQAGPAQWYHKGYSFIANSSTTTITFSDASATLTPLSSAFNSDLLLENVKAAATTAQTLTVATSPAIGLVVTVDQPDLNHNGSGVTGFTRSYGTGAVVTLKAPVFSGATIFQKWQMDGNTITTSSSLKLTIDGTHTVTAVYGPNTAPVANADFYATTMDWPLQVAYPGMLENDTDAETNPIMAVLDTAPSYGILTLNPNGAFTYTPSAGYVGKDSFTYHASDGGLISDVAKVVITILPVSPYTNGSFESGTPTDFGPLDGWTVTGNVVGYASNPPNYAAKPGNGARLAIFNSGDSVYNGVLSQRFATIAGQTYRIEFDMGITGVTGHKQSLNVTATGASPTPLLSVQEVITATGPSTVWAYPSRSHTFIADSTATTLTFRDASYAMPLSQTTQTDMLLDNVQLAAITGVNHNPVAVDVGSVSAPVMSVEEDSGPSAPITVLTNDSDVDLNPLTVTAASSPNGTVKVTSDGTLTFTPTPLFRGAATIAYTISDGMGATASATAYIAVTPVNHIPVAVDDGSSTSPYATVAEDSGPSAPINVLANDSDVDLDMLSVTKATSPNGTVTIHIDGTLAFTPTPLYHGTATIGYTISDGIGGTASATAYVAVAPVNYNPIALNDGSLESPVLTVDENSGLSAPINVLANDSDVDLDTLSVTTANSPNGSVSINNFSTLSFMPAANFSGAATISYTITDGRGGVAGATVYVAVTYVSKFTNGSFEFGNPADFGPLDGWTASGNVAGILSDPPSYAPKLGNGNRLVVFNGGNNVFNGMISQRFATIAGKTYQLKFDMGITGIAGRSQALQVTVTGEAPTPLASAQPGITATGPATYWVDPSMTYTFVADSAATTLTLSDASWTLPKYQGQYADLLLDNVQVVAISGVNHNPVAVNDGNSNSPFLTVAEYSGPSAPIAVLTNDSDVDLDSLTVTWADSSNGSVKININGTLVFTPTTGFSGSTTIDYTISDGHGGTARATVFLMVTPANDTPVATAQTITLLESGTANITLAGNDVAGHNLAYTVTTEPAHGALSGKSPNLTYTPTPNYIGQDSFEFSAHDGASISAPAAVSITISAVSGSDFIRWLASYGLVANPQVDSDSDSLSNAVEYVIGGNPAGGTDTNLLPAVSRVPANPSGISPSSGYLLFSYRRTARSNNNPAVTIQPEWSNDPGGPWAGVNGTTETVVIEFKDAFGVGVDRVDVYLPCALAMKGRLFARLGVTIYAP